MKIEFNNFRRLFVAFSLLFTSIVVGTTGFSLIENYRFLDAIYMTVITMASIGFNEVHPLSDEGKIFTALYILFNLGIFAYVVTVITQYIFEGQLKNFFKHFGILKAVSKMENHVIVCGYGRNGSIAAEELAKNKIEVVVIEKEQLSGEVQKNGMRIKIMNGDATLDESLIQAGIHKAQAIITTLPADADNVYITLTAKELNNKIRVISRASDASAEKKLIRAGANNVVLPDLIGGSHMASLITRPELVRLLNVISEAGDEQLLMEEIFVNELKEFQNLKSLSKQDSAVIVAIKKQDSCFEFNPDYEQTPQPGTSLVILGTKAQIQNFRTSFSLK